MKLPTPLWLKPHEEERLYAVLNRWIAECPDGHAVEKLELRSHPVEVDIAIGTDLRKGNQYEFEESWCSLAHGMIHVPESKNGEAISVPMVARTRKALLGLLDIKQEMEQLRARRMRVVQGQRMIADDRVFLIRENRT